MATPKQSDNKATPATDKKTTTKKASADTTKPVEAKTTEAKTDAPKATKSATTKSATPAKTTKSKEAKPAATHEEIAAAAYLISLENPGSSEEENWLKAEAQLRGK